MMTDVSEVNFSIKSPLIHLSEKLAFVPRVDDPQFENAVNVVVSWAVEHPNLSRSPFVIWDYYRQTKGLSSFEELFTLTSILLELKPQNEIFTREHIKNASRIGKSASATKLFEYWENIEVGSSPLMLEHATYLLDVGDWKRAVSVLEAGADNFSNTSRYQYLLGRAYTFRGDLDLATNCFQQALSKTRPENRSYLRLAEIYTQQGSLKEAIEALKAAASHKPHDAEISMRMIRALIQAKNYTAANDSIETLSKLGQLTPQKERFIADVRTVIDMEVVRKVRVAVITDALEDDIKQDLSTISSIGQIEVFREPRTADLTSSAIYEIINGKNEFDLVLVVNGPGRKFLSDEVFNHSFNRAAWIETAESDGNTTYLISCEFLSLLSTSFGDADTAKSTDDYLKSMQAHKDYINHLHYDGSALSLTSEGELNNNDTSGEVWLISNSGIKAFGGVERFLRGMYQVYSKFNCDPIIIGLNSDATEEAGEIDGFAYQNVPRDLSVIFRTLLEKKPVLLHTTTGTGYDIAHSAKFLNCNVVYGTHFWRDMFEGRDWFKDIDLHQILRPEYENLISLTDLHYCNSVYTQRLTFDHLNHVFSKIYSLPADVEYVPEDPTDSIDELDGLENFVLLLNSRLEKGFDILLEVAKALPNIPFLAVASQSSIAVSKEQVRRAGLKNVTIIPFVSDTSLLYKKARVVMVPSYEFVETFSRVVIEAHRYGTPVIGSDRGNVPLLLEQSGVYLPKNTDLWAEEIQNLYSSQAYYEERCSKAYQNSEEYRFDAQFGNIERVLNFCKTKVAVAVGSGIGNIVQTLPVINRISRHYGAPVDVLVDGDFNQASVLFKDQTSVSSVYIYNKRSKDRWYDTIIVLDCFGRMPPSNLAKETINLRDYVDFKLAKSMPEAEFYLYGLKIATGLDYTPDDVKDLDIRPGFRPAKVKNMVGIHGGSKDGIYAAKQWSGFETLSANLKAQGYDVFSFGSKAEYVEGTIDLTGTNLWDTINNMAKCELFISNDSGLMHVADALHIPLISLFAPTSVVKNGPLSPAATVVGISDACSPCQFDKERFASCKCIGKINVARVEAIATEKLAAVR